MANWITLIGDWIERLRALPDELVHCVVTSPPYWGLRDYGVEGQLGLESTPEEYIEKMVAGFREVRRVLRSDGTLWLNMGDTYATSPYGDGHTFDPKYNGRNRTAGYPHRQPIAGLKPKDLVGMPWMLAFALRADGWYLRQDIIWNKKNPMPESVGDRCTKAHEYIFLLSKSERYYFDQEAIKEPSSLFTHSRGKGVNPKCRKHGQHSRMQVDRDPRHLGKSETNGVGWGYDKGEPRAKSPRIRQNENWSATVGNGDIVTHRNKRSVWTLATQAFKEAHFATFPPKLIEPCILAGTSEKGCCADCGAPLERITEPTPKYAQALGKSWHDHENDLGQGMKQCRGKNGQNRARDEFGVTDQDQRYITVGWQPSCNCFNQPLFPRELQTVPCTVLDPFGGAGTTGVVAEQLGRKSILIELNPEYAAMIERRLGAVNVPA